MMNRDPIRTTTHITLIVAMVCSAVHAQFLAEDFGHPYIQNTHKDSVTILWWTKTAEPGLLEYGLRTLDKSLKSKPIEVSFSRPEKGDTVSRYKHEVKVSGLVPGKKYLYRVTQGEETFSSRFKTAPAEMLTPVRFLVWADTETELKSHGTLGSGAPGEYPLDQNHGVMACTLASSDLKPDLILLVGDVVQEGGRLEDWDEFFRKTNDRTSESFKDRLPLASHIPFFPVLGNHDYYAGGKGGGFSQPASEANAVHKFTEHFSLPDNTARTGKVDPAWPSEKNPAVRSAQNERYYAFRYGPATFIALDCCNQSPDQSDRDTNFYLLGENDPDGGHAPDFLPGSRQYQWLEEALARAKDESLFTFVYWHHAPYSSGVHGQPPGKGLGLDGQSGVPTRALDRLLHRYRVTAVFNGHEEAIEISRTSSRDSGDGTPGRMLSYFIPGTCGDGIRNKHTGKNPAMVFHYASSSIGRHYGFLVVDMGPDPKNPKSWKATFRQAWIQPQWKPGSVLNPLGGYYDEKDPSAYFEVSASIPNR